VNGREPALELPELALTREDLRPRMQPDELAVEGVELGASRRQRALATCVQPSVARSRSCRARSRQWSISRSSRRRSLNQDIRERDPVGDGELGGSGRRRRARIRGEIGERQIGLVPDRADHRHRASARSSARRARG